MIEIRINKDVGAYEPKLISVFTARQTLSLLIAAPFCYGIYRLAAPLGVPTDVVGFLCFIPAIIGFLFGWYKPFGLPLERFLRTAFISIFVAPTHRKYITVNTIQPEVTEEATPAAKKKYKCSPEAVR